MPKSALITGATGLLGRQVLAAFERESWTAIGTGFTRAQPPIRALNLNDGADVSKLLDEIR